MKSVVAAITAVLMLATPAVAASLSAADRAAIEAVETRLAPANASAGQPDYKSLATRMAELKVPGVSIAFIENGRVTWARAYGIADGAQPVTPTTLFQAASMSKAVAATAALRLVEQGKLDLDKDVNSHCRPGRSQPAPTRLSRR